MTYWQSVGWWGRNGVGEVVSVGVERVREGSQNDEN